MRRALILAAVVAIVAGIGLPQPADAQFARASLSGRVADPDGAPLPGVTVTVRNESTGVTRTAVTGASGRYVFNGLTPATYTVTFELQGFQATEREGVRLLVGQEPTLDATLQLGGVEETVTVSARAPMVETTSKEVGGNVTTEDFVQLPTQNRSFVMFASLLPGINPNPSTESTASDSLFVNGQDDNNNSFNIDGANNDDDVIGARAGAQTRTAIEAIQEFQILTTQFDAEFGRTTGGVLNAITKSGGNTLRGSGFFYYQDSDLNAKNFFTERAGAEQPDFSFKSLGGTLGGPIVRDRLHFFGSYERNTPDEGVSLNFETRPDLNFTTTEDNLLQNWMVKLDFQASNDHKIAARFLREYSPQFNQIIGNVAFEARREEDDTDTSFVGSIDSVVGDTGFNNLRVSLTREDVSFANPGYNDNGQTFAAQRALDVSLARPSVVEGASTVAQSRINESWQIDDTFSLYLADTAGGDHDLRVGGSYSHRTEEFFNSGTANGQFSFDTDRPFDADDITTYPQSFAIRVNGETTAEIPANDVWGLFFQDDFQPTDNLTLNLGVRWDKESITDDNNNIAPRLGFAWDPTGEGRTVVRGGFGRFYERFQLGSFAGTFLDAISGTGGFVSSLPVSGVDQQLFFDIAQANGITDLNDLRDFLAAMLEDGATAGLNLFPTVDNPDRVQAYADTFSVGVQHEVLPNLSVGADYIHTENNDIVVAADLNPFSASQGGRPNISVYQGQQVALGSITTYVNAGESTYDALQLSIDRRMADSAIGRFQGRLSYTYADQDGNAAPENVEFSNRWQFRTESGFDFDTGQFLGEPVDLGLENNAGMPAPWHRDHNFVASWAWIVPGTSWEGRNSGLMMSGVFRWMSGDRFTPILLDRLDNNARMPASPGILEPGQSSDIALDPVDFDGTENGVENPDFRRLDLSFRYRFPLRVGGRDLGLTVLADIFNVTDRVNFSGVGSSFADTAGFLVPNSAFQPREFQLGARVDF